MIEIKCSQTQKNKIIKALATGETPCLFPRSMPHCSYDKNMSCQKCLETKIKWTIT